MSTENVPTSQNASHADLVIVGAGFFGLRIALFAREVLGAERVVVLESEPEVMTRASFVNQARVHNGYHYPRSILTAYRSRVSSRAFADEYREAVFDDFRHYYAVASRLSKVNARQFEVFCDRIGAVHTPASADVTSLFSPALIERVWEVEEKAFDARILRRIMLERLDAAGGIEIFPSTVGVRVLPSPRGAAVETDRMGTIHAPHVISSVYSQLNTLHRRSGLPTVPLQQEITEMALVALPERLRGFGVTVMDGPFFSIMPFPSAGLHTLSHVRYTPHGRWRDVPGEPDSRPIPSRTELEGHSTFREMLTDVRRYVPAFADMTQHGSVREVKTVLADDDRSDSRPVLVRAGFGVDGYIAVMGGKIDNINDVLHELAVKMAHPAESSGELPHGPLG